MIPMAQLLLSAGPSLIRMAGRAFGDKGERVGNTIADVVEAVKGKPAVVAEASINQAVAGMTPDEMSIFSQMQIRLAEIAADREKNQLNHDLGIYTQEQETHRTEAAEGTDYVKETRPKIARQSAAITFIYVLSFEFIKTIYVALDLEHSGADWQIAGALISPCLGYMGMRTIDAFSKWKTAPGQLLAKIGNR